MKQLSLKKNRAFLKTLILFKNNVILKAKQAMKRL